MPTRGLAIANATAVSIPPTAQQSSIERNVTSPMMLGPIYSPTAPSSMGRNSPAVWPRRAAPAPPAETTAPDAMTDQQGSASHVHNTSTSESSHLSRSEENEEIVFTPLTPGLTRKVTHRRIAPENDPEVRKDFEARIAAATAALNRTPSNPGSSISRKFSRSRHAVNISSPRLMSTSSTLTTTPLSTPDSLDAATARALEKASGSSGKMSFRWKKLKKGLSFSGDGNNPFPPPSQSPPDGRILEEAIALRREDTASSRTKPVTITSPDINAFKFPHSATSEQFAPRPQIPLPSPKSSAPIASLVKQTARGVGKGPSKVISAESSPEKFVKVGRAAGLDDDQLEEMMVVNGLGRSQSTTELPARAQEALHPRSTNTEDPSATASGGAKLKSSNSMSKAKGLLRSMSKGRKVEPALNPDLIDTHLVPHSLNDGDDSTTPTPTASNVNLNALKAIEAEDDRKKIVRRTLLIAAGLSHHQSPLMSRDSPSHGSSGSPSAAQRKGSVKRKPLNLSKEDHRLVSDTPSPHSRNFSTTSSTRSDGSLSSPPLTQTSPKSVHSSQPADAKPHLPNDNAGLGFLQPPPPMMRSASQGTAQSGISGISGIPSDQASGRRSSGGGSFFDYYGNENHNEDGDVAEETLLSPSQDVIQRHGEARRSTQAVEITSVACPFFEVSFELI